MMKISDADYDREYKATKAKLLSNPKVLALKESYIGKHDRQQHVSNMRVRSNDDGTFCIWISNGENKTAMFVMRPDTKKQLIEFLQKF